jgi:hypothetical protein
MDMKYEQLRSHSYLMLKGNNLERPFYLQHYMTLSVMELEILGLEIKHLNPELLTS